MDLRAKRVIDFHCGSCGFAVHDERAKPLSRVECPGCGNPLMVPGQFDQFLLSGAIRVGTSGTIFKAFDTKLHRPVAVKILRGRTPEDRQLAERCLASGRLLATVNHPSVAYIYGVGRYHDQDYIVKELVTGGTADALLKSKEPLPETEALKFAIAVAEGLEAALRVGLLHTNLKPSNILITEERKPKLIEFNTTRVGERDKQGGLICTPYYVAPEIVAGRKPNLRSDVYSLGVTLFYLLARKCPIRGKDALKLKLKYKPPSILKYREDVTEQTSVLLSKMLRVNPDKRFESYTQLISAMRVCLKAAERGPVRPKPAQPDSDSTLEMLAMAKNDPDSYEQQDPRKSNDTAVAALEGFNGFDDEPSAQARHMQRRSQQSKHQPSRRDRVEKQKDKDKDKTGIPVIREEDMRPKDGESPESILENMARANWVGEGDDPTMDLYGDANQSMDSIIRNMENAQWAPPEDSLIWDLEGEAGDENAKSTTATEEQPTG